jgi:Rieske Fe-S protein
MRCYASGRTTRRRDRRARVFRRGDRRRRQLFCSKHGATFTYDGDATKGPAFFPLLHFEMCTLSNGHVGVVTSQTVPKTQRLLA